MSTVADRLLPLPAGGAFGIKVFDQLGRSAFAAVSVWQTNMRQRRELLMLNSVELRELSLAVADVNREANRPFWTRLGLTGR